MAQTTEPGPVSRAYIRLMVRGKAVEMRSAAREVRDNGGGRQGDEGENPGEERCERGGERDGGSECNTGVLCHHAKSSEDAFVEKLFANGCPSAIFSR